MFAALAAMAFSFVACDKDKKDGENEDETGIKLEYRITSLDGKAFTYNADGKVASYGNDEEVRTFVYEGNKLTIKDKWKDNGAWSEEIIEYEMTLNDKGFATEVKYGEGNVLTITYDETVSSQRPRRMAPRSPSRPLRTTTSWHGAVMTRTMTSGVRRRPPTCQRLTLARFRPTGQKTLA